MDTAIFPIINNEAGLPFLLCGIGINKHQCHIQREEGYCIHQVIYCVNGVGILSIDGQEIKIRPNTLFFLPPNIPHEYYGISSDPWSTNWITFTGENISFSLNKLDMSNWRVFELDSIDAVDTIFRRIIGIFKSEQPLSGYTASGLLYELLIECFKGSCSEGMSQTTQENSIIRPVINFINDNYHKDISLADMAKMSNCTPEHLCKVFKAHVGLRPFEYLAKKRIQEAKRLLSTNLYTISQVGKMVGYTNNSYFCSVFKKYEKLSPSEFRGNSYNK